MKWLFLSIFVVLSSSVIAQDEFIAPRGPQREIVEETVTPPTSGPDIDGIVAQVFKNKAPLQMVNPLAPQRYGNGRENISWSENHPGKPKGIILFGIKW